MENNLNGRVALITGASSGIGKAIAYKLAGCGATVVLFGGRNKENLENAKAYIESTGAPCLAIGGDITDRKMQQSGIEKVITAFGKIDILINNAGSALGCPFSEVTEEQFDSIMNLDVKVPFFLTQSALPYLRESSYAAVVNISSVVGKSGYPLQSAYSTAKHALHGFSQSLAKELYKENIRVHVLSPGGVYTDMIKITRPDLAGDNMILPEDVADIVAFLLLNRSNAVIDEVSFHRTGKEPFLV